MIYNYNYTEEVFGGDTTREEADSIAEAIKWSVEDKFDGVDFVTKYDPNWVNVNYFDGPAEEEAAESVRNFLDQNWSDIAGQVLEGTFWKE